MNKLNWIYTNTTAYCPSEKSSRSCTFFVFAASSFVFEPIPKHLLMIKKATRCIKCLSLSAQDKKGFVNNYHKNIAIDHPGTDTQY